MFRKLHDPNSNITIEIDGVPTSAEPGDTVAAALLRQAELGAAAHAVAGKGAEICMMGVCFECLAEVDGVSSFQTCLKAVCDGMKVARQRGKPEITR